jgi:hypothetical protein
VHLRWLRATALAVWVAVLPSSATPLQDGGVITPAKAVVPLTMTSFDGVVTGVDDRSVSLRGFGARVLNAQAGGASETGAETWVAGPAMVVSLPRRDVPCVRASFTRETMVLTSRDGTVTTYHRSDEPVRRFPVDAMLARGGFHADLLPGGTYRLSDVRVGDEVSILLGRERQDGICYSISIRRRPRGHVPPAPGEGPDPRLGPYHERRNAEQDYEYLGIPLPDRFRTSENVIRARMQQMLAPPSAK